MTRHGLTAQMIAPVKPVSPSQSKTRTRPLPRGLVKALVGGLILAVIVIVTIGTIWLSPYDPNQQVLVDRLKPPAFLGGSDAHLLGTDQLGRDMLSRLMAGGRVSLSIGALAVLASTVLGTLLGLLAGYYGRQLDALLTMLAEVQLALPSILIILIFLSLIGPSVVTLGLVLALSDWVIYARTVRGRALVEANREYVQAARAVGAGHARIIFKHIWPNVVPTIMVLATVSLGGIILTESSLSFLGLGVARPTPSWGRMVADGQSYVSTAGWISALPAMTIGTVVVAVNLLGDGLRQLMKME